MKCLMAIVASATIAAFLLLAVFSCEVEVSMEVIQKNSTLSTHLRTNVHEVTLGSMRYLSAVLDPPASLSSIASLIFMVHPVFMYGVNYTCNSSCWLPGNDVFAEYLLPNGTFLWVHHVGYRSTPVHVVLPEVDFEPLREGYYSATSSHWLKTPLQLAPQTPPLDDFHAVVVYDNLSAVILVDGMKLYNDLAQVFKLLNKSSPPPVKVKLSKVLCREAVEILVFAKPPTQQLLVLRATVHGFNPLGFHVASLIIDSRVFNGSEALLPQVESLDSPLKVKVLLRSSILPVSLVREVEVPLPFNTS